MKKKQSLTFGDPKKPEPPKSLDQGSFVDQRSGLLILKKLKSDFGRAKKNLARYYKESGGQRLTVGEKVGLIWFLENYHQIEEVEDFIEELFDPRSASSLPLVGRTSPEIKIVSFLSLFISERKGFTLNNLTRFLKACQKKERLTLAELWFVPTALKILLLIELEKTLRPIFADQSGEKIVRIDREVKYLVLALINVTKINWKKFVEATSAVERILMKDPAGVYAQMDFETRNTYRHTAESIAKRSGKSEVEVATSALEMARESKKGDRSHIGHFLAGLEKKRLEEALGYKPGTKEAFKRLMTKTQGRCLNFALVLVSLLVTLFLSVFFDGWTYLYVFLPLWLILIAAMEAVFHRILIKVFPPQPLFRLNYERKVARDSRTLVVVPTLLTENPKDPESLLENLELNHLANRDKNIFFGLLLSFQESKNKEDKPTEAQLKNLDLLKEGLERLNKKYPHQESVFSIMFRKRFWSDRQEACIEWERKRGKIIELSRLLRGRENVNFHLVTASRSTLKSIRYVITLDRGELLAKGAAKKLIATIGHPLNAPDVDGETRTVRSGYGIIQPSMIGFKGDNNSFFDKIFGGWGWDSYSGTSSNVYQDVFSEGAFFGKGIFDVDTFLEVIDGRFLEDVILSHDLIEGFYCRTGQASDIQVFEEEPLDYLSYAKRKERWTRGDWQNLFWLFGSIKSEKGLRKERNPLLFYHKWRVFDNLLRSLIFPLSSFILVFSWLVFESRPAFIMTVVVLLALNAESLVALIDLFPSRRLVFAWRYYLKKALDVILVVGLDIIFKIVFMLHLATLSLSAIFRALYRVLISHKKTLEWQAFHLTRGGGKSLIVPMISLMLLSQLMALFFGTLYFMGEPRPLPSVILGAWLVAPFVACLFSSARRPKERLIDEKDVNRIRLIALKTWRFFEELVGGGTNYLPPDRFLDHGRGKMSPMTSITNVGVYLLSARAAADLGYIGSFDFLVRLGTTMKSLSRLDRFRGHFFNWYDIKNKKPLPPRYISTVDSGNFAASLLTLRNSARGVMGEEIIGDNLREALNDYAIMMLRTYDETSLKSGKADDLEGKIEGFRRLNLSLGYRFPRQSKESLGLLREKIGLIKRSYPGETKEAKKKGFLFWLDRSEKLVEEKGELLTKTYPWLEARGLSQKCSELLESLEFGTSLLALKDILERKGPEIDSDRFTTAEKEILESFLSPVRDAIRETETLIGESVALIDELLEEMDFGFLYDREKELFRIGYSVDRKRFDRNCYDLFASEARLASFLALAKDDVALDHWPKLGRPLTHYKGRLVLLSWGGSIFEYFFPQMFLPTKKSTLLDVAQETALRAQMEYGRKNEIPWGISESSYVQKNQVGEYLYKMHGVPILGMRRSKRKDMVVAPYATFLALERSPHEAVENIKRLQHLGVENKFGFYESIDFARKSEGEVAKVYMAHHQGAIIVSVVNYLKERLFEKRFMENPEAKSLAYLLEERVAVRGKLKSVFHLKKKAPKLTVDSKREKEKSGYLGPPLIHLLSNGRLKSFVSNRGSGSLQYENIELIPFEEDPVIDVSGNFIYIKDNRKNNIWSAAFQPTRVESEDYDCFFGNNYVKIDRLDFGISSSLEVFVHPNLNAEIRALTLTNKSQQRRDLSVCSFGEVSLFGHNEYRSHPNFQKLKTISRKRDSALIFKRRVSRGDHSPVFAHLAFFSSKNKEAPKTLTEKGAFIGEGSLSRPGALEGGLFPNNISGFDKAFAVSGGVSLLPLEKKTVYFVNLYAGKEERLPQALEGIGGFEDLSSLLETCRPKASRKRPPKLVTQKIVSLLFYGHRREIETKRLAPEVKNRFGIDWNLPTVAVELKQTFSKTFAAETLNSLAQLVLMGLEINIVVIAHEKDEYSQKTNSFVEKTVGLIESGLGDHKIKLAERVTVINEASIEKEVYESLISGSDLYWDASKRSLESLVESEFRKI